MAERKLAQEMTYSEITHLIDFAILEPYWDEDTVKGYIHQAVQYECALAAMNPTHLEFGADITVGTKTKFGVSSDFPFGQGTTESRILEAESYCKSGVVQEIDFVSRIWMAKSGRWADYTADLKALADICKSYGVLSKVIIESDCLTLDEVRRATVAAADAGMDFVKTSTGYVKGVDRVGPTPEVIKAMIEAAEGRIHVKASSVIRNKAKVIELVNLGVERMGIGCTSVPVVLGVSPEEYQQVKDQPFGEA